jgi:hypothetical protein
MKKHRTSILPACAALLSVCAVAGAQDKPDANAYMIKLARPLKVGMKYAMSADGALVRQVTLKRGFVTQKRPDDGFGVRFEGTVEVLALDDIGEEAKVACTVDKCIRLTSDGETELVPKGKVLIAEGKGKDTVFSLKDGGDLPKEASDALELVISLDTNDKLTDDDLLGTKEKKKVGESWPVTPENIAKDSERVGVAVKPEDVEGSFRLDGLQKVGDTECLKLSGNLKVKHLVTKSDENEDDRLPEGYVVEGGSMEAKYSGLFPVDMAVGSLAESASMTFVTHIRGKGGAGGAKAKAGAKAGAKDGDEDAVTIESRVQRAVEMKRRWLDPKS